MYQHGIKKPCALIYMEYTHDTINYSWIDWTHNQHRCSYKAIKRCQMTQILTMVSTPSQNPTCFICCFLFSKTRSSDRSFVSLQIMEHFPSIFSPSRLTPSAPPFCLGLCSKLTSWTVQSEYSWCHTWVPVYSSWWIPEMCKYQYLCHSINKWFHYLWILFFARWFPESPWMCNISKQETKDKKKKSNCWDEQYDREMVTYIDILQREAQWQISP